MRCAHSSQKAYTNRACATRTTTTHQAVGVGTTLVVALMVIAAGDVAELEFVVLLDGLVAHAAFVCVFCVSPGHKQMPQVAPKARLGVQALCAQG